MNMAVTDQREQPLFDRFTGFLLLVGWLGYILLSPYYFFKSGLPQIADYLIFVVSGFCMIIFFMKRSIIFNRIFTILILMVALFFSINMIYFLFYKDIVFLLSSLYYIHNAFIFTATVILFRFYPEKIRIYGGIAICISMILQLFWVFLFDNPLELRETGSFNNPNQLAYWSLLSVCYLMIIRYGNRLKWYDYVTILITLFFISQALSRAVFFSYIIVIGALMVGQYASIFFRTGLMLVILLYALVQITVFDNPAFLIRNFAAIESIANRIESIQTEEGVLEERGYQRIINYSENLLYGAGEGYYTRFREFGGNPIELHSGLGTILFSYGVLGFILFSGFVITVFHKSPWTLWTLLAAVMIYGITHQHIRFSGFWVFMGLAYGMTRYVVIPRQEAASSRLPQSHHPLSLTGTNAGRSI